MSRPAKFKRYRADVREPYMGNTLPLAIDVVVDEDGYILNVQVITTEGIVTKAEYLYDQDVQ